MHEKVRNQDVDAVNKLQITCICIARTVTGEHLHRAAVAGESVCRKYLACCSIVLLNKFDVSAVTPSFPSPIIRR